MNIRKFIFLLKDRLLNDGAFNKNTDELRTEFQLSFPSKNLKLNNILEYSVKHVEYYKKFENFSSYKDFPVLTKDVIKINYECFLSSEYKDGLEKLHKVTTSGSYGTPFTFYLNKEKRRKVVSEVYYFGEKSNFYLGMKHAYLVSKSKGKLSQFIQNQLMITVDKLDDNWCESAFQSLKDGNVKVLVGYPSAIARLASYVLNKKIQFPMHGVITISEVLTSNNYNIINKAFSCAPVSRYSTEEFGVLANQDTSGCFFYLNQCNYFIEILSQSNNCPAKIGELGRVVVTDFFNKSMPLIRYDTGDLARPYEIKNNIVTKIESVEGRVLAVIRDVAGDTVSSFSINGALRDYENIIQFQFSQEGFDEYLLKIIKKNNIDEENIKNLYKGILGETARVNIIYVDDIPPLASGKRPYILQNHY